MLIKLRKTLKPIKDMMEVLLPPYLYIKILIFFYKLLNKYFIKKLSKKSGVNLLSIEKLKMKKKSDFLFILGSGSSINNINEKQWRIIKNNDSIGFNFWLYHDFVPTFYCYEENFDKNRNLIFYQLLEKKKEDYRNTIFIVKDLEYKGFSYNLVSPTLLKNFLLSYEIVGYGYTKKKFKSFLEEIDKKNILMKKTGTLSYLIYLGKKMGYKKIILCGIDLENQNYFFEAESYKKRYPIVNNKKNKNKKFHETEISTSNNMPMSLVIETLKEFFINDKIEIELLSNQGYLKKLLKTFNEGE